jgi:DNA polymerase I-like protein with 3'-5' exonuclease and polymerase domains
MNVITIDFETYPIINGAPFSPKPVGVSIKIEDNSSYYYAWGHTSENNCSLDEAILLLQGIFRSDAILVMHNAKFDLAVAMQHMGCRLPLHYHDTMLMAYLNDPREASLKLKDLAPKYCNIPPNEQQDLKSYIMSNNKVSENIWGSLIYTAPGGLVGKYAEADTDMTYALYNYFKGILQ